MRYLTSRRGGRARRTSAVLLPVTAVVTYLGVQSVAAPPADDAPRAGRPAASPRIAATPNPIALDPGECSPSTTQVALTSADGKAGYATVDVAVPGALRTSRRTFTTFVPATGPAAVPVEVTTPGSTPPGTYTMSLTAGRTRTVVPVVVAERPSGAGSNVARGQETTASSIGNLTSACGVVDGNYTYTLEGYNRPPTAWADGSPGVFPDFIQTRFARAATIDRVDVYTHPEQRFALRDFDIEVLTSGGWLVVGSVRGHTAGRSTTTFSPVTAEAVRIKSIATNGYAYAIITEVEAFAS